MKTRERRGISVLLPLAALLAACGGGQAPEPVAARQFNDPGFVAAGGYEMHYGVLSAYELAPEVAARNGIDQGNDALVVSVSILRHETGKPAQAVAAVVNGSSQGLTGESDPLAFRQIEAGSSLSYLALVPARAGEVIVLELEARPPGDAPALHARLTRQLTPRRRSP